MSQQRRGLSRYAFSKGEASLRRLGRHGMCGNAEDQRVSRCRIRLVFRFHRTLIAASWWVIDDKAHFFDWLDGCTDEN